LGGAADHLLALFTPALLLSSVRAARSFEVGPSCAVGMLMAGAILTKYQATYSLVAVGVLFAGRFIYLTLSELRREDRARFWRQRWLGLGALGASATAFASPYFIENAIRYRNPVYPLAQGFFKNSTPSMPGAAEMVAFLFKDHNWHPPDALWPRIRATGEMLFTFSFESHYSFVRNLPCFGFLFTLVLPFLFVIPKSRRLWTGYLVAAVAVFTWAFTFWVDRNLQTFLPILGAATGAVIVRVWDLGLIARLGLVPLVALQIAWGGDFMFSGSDRLQSSVDLIRSGFDGRAEQRFAHYRREFLDLGSAMPVKAVALLHNFHPSLGIDRTIYLDWVGFQGLIDYRTFQTPRDAYDRFAALGITHIIYNPGWRTAPSKQEDIIFHALAVLFANDKGRFGRFALLEMPKVAPPQQKPFRVLALSIGNYQNGIYPIRALGTCEEMPSDRQVYVSPDVAVVDPTQIANALTQVDAALVSASISLTDAARAVLDRQFRQVIRYDNQFAVYVRPPSSGS
ncbi:MAG: hypothetical protein M3O46_04635, partial [Myxococcota bacterium]|nr:hypothetical protein [Myxococcota bacterium]